MRKEIIRLPKIFGFFRRDEIMKKLWKRIPKWGKVALNLLLIVGILFLAWWKLGYPMPTAEAAFRKAQREALLPGSWKLEAVVTYQDDDGNHSLGLGCDGSTACIAALSHGKGWKGSGARVYEPIDGAFLAPTPGYKIGAYDLRECGPFLAVKVPGAVSIRVSVELDEYRPQPDLNEKWKVCPGGSYPMEMEEADNGWFLARFAPETTPADAPIGGEGPNVWSSDPAFYNYSQWIYAVSEQVRDSRPYFQRDGSGRFRVEALDESGTVIKTVIWDPLAD